MTMRSRVGVRVRVMCVCVCVCVCVFVCMRMCVLSCTGGGQMRWATGGGEVGVRTERGGKG